MPDLTIDEIDSEVTTLYYLQRVNYEAADEVTKRAEALWAKLPEGQRLHQVAVSPGRGREDYHAYSGLLHGSNAAVLTNTAALSVLLKPDMWPTFIFEPDNPTRDAQIDTWTELIGLSEEANEIREAVMATQAKIRAALVTYGVPAQDMRGWYVKAHTSRRNTVGWAVAGRGNTLHIKPDPLAGVRRIAGAASIIEPVTDLQIARYAAHAAIRRLDPEVERYSIKSSDVSLILPPDMASERREWSTSILTTAATHVGRAGDIWKEYCAWHLKADPILRRQKVREDWVGKLPKDFSVWAKNDGPSRYTSGMAETMAVLFGAAGLTNDDLRLAVEYEYLRRNPLYVVTPADAAVLDSKPAEGYEDLPETLAQLVLTKRQNLAPMF